MGIYDSAENYAKELNMTIEQAIVRLDYFKKAKEEMDATRVCPTCGQPTLSVEAGEWESGVPDWIYCGNDNVEKINDDGETYLDGCEFTDSVKQGYLFAFEHDFDAVLMMSCGLDIKDEKAVYEYIGQTWDEFVKKDTEVILRPSKPIGESFKFLKDLDLGS